MGADGISKFKHPFPLPDRCPAEKNVCFNSYILNRFDADDLVNVKAKQLMMLVFHPQA